MASELARQILDAGFPAAKPVREHDLFGITPPRRALSRRWNNFALNFAFPLGASIPTNGKRTADLLQSMVKSLIGHDMAQPPPKHWLALHAVTIGSGQLFVRTLPHNTERRSPTDKVTGRAAIVQPLQARRIAQNQPLLRYQAALLLTLLLTTPFSRCTARTSSACSASPFEI